jgi:metal-responsive CopG/Arc/MetJ family transcriptional regulator
MKIETKIILEEELLQQLERLLRENGQASLSELIEDLLKSFLVDAKKPAYDLRELELINRNANRLNKEAEDVLTYQIAL